MAGRFYFRDDLYMPFRCILQEINKFGTGIIAVSRCSGKRVVSTVVGRVLPFLFIGGMSPSRTDCCQFFQARNFQAPAFIVREMEMEHIQFIGRKNIYEFLQIINCCVIAGNINHLSPVY